MINVHLNGDIVRCVDTAANLRRVAEIREKHRICKYNYHEDNCSTWQNSQACWSTLLRSGCSGRCTLSGSDICPGSQRRKTLGNMVKSYKIDNGIYRKCASSAHYLVKESKTKTLFLTLTFPKFKRKVSLNEINQYFSKYVENLRKNYNAGGYIAVRELGEKKHRVHFHILISIPFVKFSTLNDSWCNCIKDICDYSRNALTSDPKTKFVTDPVRAMRYVCKYFAKCKGQTSPSRMVFMSNNILQHPKKVYDCIDTVLTGYKGLLIQQTSDYSTLFRITNEKEFSRFCDEFLYPLFELSGDNCEYLYSFPQNSS